MITKQEAKKMDKFYTQKELAERLVKKVFEKLSLTEEEYFLEPSAGAGSFSGLLKNVDAYDIAPEAEGIVKADFLEVKLERKDYVSIGNPPFGNRSGLAVDFFEKCSKNSKAIAFVVPNTFLKWSVQSTLNKDFALIHSEQLEENSFTFMGDVYGVRCCFQIWVNKNVYSDVLDLRMTKKPATSHPDFKIWQHNATEGSKKYVDEPWEIAVWRQGYKDYNKTFSQKDYEWLKEQVNTTKLQFFFIQPMTEMARTIISKMDFDNLAKRNMTTPGFGKADFVAYYEEIEKQLKAENKNSL